jgi:hypothetical protein
LLFSSCLNTVYLYSKLAFISAPPHLLQQHRHQQQALLATA